MDVNSEIQELRVQYRKVTRNPEGFKPVESPSPPSENSSTFSRIRKGQKIPALEFQEENFETRTQQTNGRISYS